jgi:hypothetical protein
MSPGWKFIGFKVILEHVVAMVKAIRLYQPIGSPLLCINVIRRLFFVSY